MKIVASLLPKCDNRTESTEMAKALAIIGDNYEEIQYLLIIGRREDGMLVMRPSAVQHSLNMKLCVCV